MYGFTCQKNLSSQERKSDMNTVQLNVFNQQFDVFQHSDYAIFIQHESAHFLGVFLRVCDHVVKSPILHHLPERKKTTRCLNRIREDIWYDRTITGYRCAL